MKPVQYRNRKPLEYLPNDFRIALRTGRFRDFEFIIRRKKRKLPGIVVGSVGLALLITSEFVQETLGLILFAIAALITAVGIHFELINRIVRQYKYFVVPGAAAFLILAFMIWPRAFSIILPRQHVTLLSHFKAGFPVKSPKLVVMLGGGRKISMTYTKAQLEKAKPDSFQLSATAIPFRLYLDNGKLLIDADVFAGVNSPPIRIRRNVIHGLPFAWDGNYNSKAFEIISSDTIPVFQFICKSADSVVVKGVFRKGGELIIANQSGVSSVQGKRVLFYKTKPIFKYPSWKYPHELASGH